VATPRTASQFNLPHGIWVAPDGRVLVADGANSFNPYVVSKFARKEGFPPDELLKKISVARAFTCHQLATLIRKRLEPFIPSRVPSLVVFLGPCTVFFDEDVPGEEAALLFRRTMAKVEEMSRKGVFFLMSQSFSGLNKHRSFLLKELVRFSDTVLKLKTSADALQEASLMLGPMNRAELHSAIEKPAEMQGAAFEPGLVERILDDVGEKPGNLPLLEFTLTQLWERQTDGWLTHADYESMGCVEGALAAYAEQVFAELDKSEQELALGVQDVGLPGQGGGDVLREEGRISHGAVVIGPGEDDFRRRVGHDGKNAIEHDLPLPLTDPIAPSSSYVPTNALIMMLFCERSEPCDYHIGFTFITITAFMVKYVVMFFQVIDHCIIKRLCCVPIVQFTFDTSHPFKFVWLYHPLTAFTIEFKEVTTANMFLRSVNVCVGTCVSRSE
jgi:hypothetical protein